MIGTPSKLMLYVQYAISEGLQPDENGVYTISRNDFITGLDIPASTFDKNKKGLLEAMDEWDLEISFGLRGLLWENLYTDVKYENGALTFKRNPITMRPELSYVWGIKPPYWDRKIFVYPHIPVPKNVRLPIKK